MGYSETLNTLSANPDPHCGLDLHLRASRATPGPSGMPRGLGKGSPEQSEEFLCRVLLGQSLFLAGLPLLS